jgi:hypothetical protein
MSKAIIATIRFCTAGWYARRIQPRPTAAG